MIQPLMIPVQRQIGKGGIDSWSALPTY